ncbi:AREL1_3 [Blepharisma stoltei]|uniref:HECT-type E3 ubiquitin transferase n=1 Tax=Blepharisma stoltei TaxID=1481888 RepID=A0AAU9JAU3_9CILI|nr:unnamed protein product [Blepharisma stoltei]
MGCCVTKAQTAQVHLPRVPIETALARSPVSRQNLNELSSFLLCPYCLEEFRDNTTIRNFTEHLLICISHGRTARSHPRHTLKNLTRESPYNVKIQWLKDELTKIRIPWQSESMKLEILRDEFMETSMNHILTFTPQDMHKEFNVSFSGERGMDAGGVLREWFTLITKALFSKEKELFVLSNAKIVNYTFPLGIDGSKENEYVFMGRVMGKALFEQVSITCPLSGVIFKHITGDEINLEDLNFLDNDLYSALKFMKENPIETVFFETFQVEKHQNGQVYKYLLKENGDQIKVTDENKEEYIELRAKFETTEIMKPGIDFLLQGFYAVIPQPLVSFFTSQELELALCGLPVIDIQDWKDHTDYRGEFSRSHKVVGWFWEVVESLAQEQVSNLLLFVTGSPRLSIDGFASLRTSRGEPARFTIEPIHYDKNSIFPRAHTCFNRLDLPIYPSKEILEKGLVYVIKNHALGFGIE